MPQSVESPVVTIPGLPEGAILKPLVAPKTNDNKERDKGIEGLPKGAIVKSLTHDKPSRELTTGPRATGSSPSPHRALLTPDSLTTRLFEAMGIPRDSADWKELAQTWKDSATKPGGIVQVAATNYGKGLYKAAGKSALDLLQAVADVKRGKPVGAALYKAAGAYGHTLAAATPIVGPIVEHIYQDMGKGNVGGAIGGALGFAGNAVLLKLGTPYSEAEKVDRLAYATDDYPEAYRTALPDIEETAAQTGTPKTVKGLKGTVDQTKQRLTTEFSQALQPIAGQQVVPQQIADAITAPIRNKPNLAKTPEGLQLRRELQQRAVSYQKPWTMRELDQERMDANARLRSYYNTPVSGKMAKTRLEADIIVDKAIVDGAKDIVYPAMDKVNGKPAGTYANLKQRQSSLIDIYDRLDKRVQELDKARAVRKGAPLLAKEGQSIYAHPGGRVGMSFHRIQNLIRAPEAAADTVVKRTFRGTRLPTPATRVAQVATATLPVRVLLHEDEGFKTLNELEGILNKQGKGK